MRVGIIGANGWLGAILGRRLLDSGVVTPDRLAVLTRDARSQPLYSGYAGVTWARDADDIVARCDVIVVSVRPHDWEDVILAAPGRLLISFMAGITLSDLAQTGARCARAMPNAAAELGKSYTPWIGDGLVTAGDAATLENVLSVLGSVERLHHEVHLELMAAVPGSGSAYPALMAQAMLDWLTQAGVAPETACRAVEGVICNAAQLLEGRIAQACQVLHDYRDYRGMTAAGLDAADAAGFSSSMRIALDAAVERGRMLRRQPAGGTS